MNNKRIGIYLRVSTQDQSTELQANEIQAYAASRGWTDLTLYEDKATGTNCNRPQLKLLLQASRQRKLDIIVVWKLDRFARSLKDMIAMLQELTELGVDFISIRDNLDLTTSAGRLMIHIVSAFAEFEASMIKERVRAGISNAKAKGTRLGRKPTIDQSKVCKLRAQGWSLGKIAKFLGVSKAGVHKVLSQNPPTNAVTNLETTEHANSFKKL